MGNNSCEFANVPMEFPFESKLSINTFDELNTRQKQSQKTQTLCEEHFDFFWEGNIAVNGDIFASFKIFLLRTTELPNKFPIEKWIRKHKNLVIMWHHIITNALLHCWRSKIYYLLLMSSITPEPPFEMNRFSCSANKFQPLQRNCCTTSQTIINGPLFQCCRTSLPSFSSHTKFFLFSTRMNLWMNTNSSRKNARAKKK